MDFAYPAAAHRVTDRLVPGVETAIEADHEGDAGARHRLEGLVHQREVKAHRLLAEDRLARLGRLDDQGDMGVGARADGDGVDVLGGEEFLDRRHARAGGLRHCVGRLGHDVGHGHQLESGDVLGKDPGMHAADPAAPDHPDPTDRNRRVLCRGKPSVARCHDSKPSFDPGVGRSSGKRVDASRSP